MNTYTNLSDAADLVNAAYAAGHPVRVNGADVRSWSAAPAKIWGTGSLSVDTRAKAGGGKVNPLWFKPGAKITVDVGGRA